MAPLHVYGKSRKTYSRSLRTPGRTAPSNFAQFLDEPDNGLVECMDGADEQKIIQRRSAAGKGLRDDKRMGAVRDSEATKRVDRDRDVGTTKMGDVLWPTAAKSKTIENEAEKNMDIQGPREDEEMDSLFRRLNLGPQEAEDRNRKSQVPELRERQQQPSRRSSTKVAVSVAVPNTERQKSLSAEEEIIVFNDRGQKTGRLSRNALEYRDRNTLSRSQEQSKQDVVAKQKKTQANIQDIENLASTLEQTSLEHNDDAVTTDKLHSNKRGGSGSKPAESVAPPMNKTRQPKEQDADIPSAYASDVYTTYVSSLLPLSDQPDIISFDEWAQTLEEHVSIEKIAEASFSEVYRLTVKDASLASAKESVLKLVSLKMPPSAPLPGEIQKAQAPRSRRKVDNSAQLEKERLKREEDDEWKSAVADVLGEVRLLQNLTSIPGFTIFRSLSILQGRPPPFFAHAWRRWNKARPRTKKSHYPDPTYKSSYEATQLWAVIEMDDAGTDVGKIIEAGGVSTIWEVWDIFWGVCMSVAKAEEACRFEHRDLHMDNICIRALDRSNSDLTEARIRNPLKRKLGFSGLETTVIDYTLSRADIVLEGRGAVKRRSPEIAYLDLDKDQSLFEGDADVEYQYEIYRYMWGVVYHNDPLNQGPVDSAQHPVAVYEDEKEKGQQVFTPETPRRSPRKYKPNAALNIGGNNTFAHRLEIPETPVRSSPGNAPSRSLPPKIWELFHPKTNLVWAHFILHTLLQHLHSLGKEPASLSTEEILADITPPFSSPQNSFSDKEREKIHRKAIKLHKALRKVAKLLEPRALGERSRVLCVGDLVVLGLEAEWLGVRDVRGA